MRIIITAATKGIGLATSELFFQQGYKVIGVARNAINNFPGTLYQCDLSCKHSVQELSKYLANKYSFDVIFNNYGINKPDSLMNLTITDLEEVLLNNTVTATILTQALLPNMIKNKKGRIINNSSTFIHGKIGRTAYASSKAALVGATKTWALELAPYNITSNAIAPGPTQTELFSKGFPEGSRERETLVNQIPLNRLAKPQEIASLVSYLASDLAGFITGQLFYIDGGLNI